MSPRSKGVTPGMGLSPAKQANKRNVNGNKNKAPSKTRPPVTTSRKQLEVKKPVL